MTHTGLRAARKARRLQQKELAARTGIDQATISRLETGETVNPSNDTVQKLERALRLKRGTLVFGVEAQECVR